MLSTRQQNFRNLSNSSENRIHKTFLISRTVLLTRMTKAFVYRTNRALQLLLSVFKSGVFPRKRQLIWLTGYLFR